MAVFWGVFRYSAASKIAETSEKPKQGKFAEANKPNLPKQISRSKEKFWELQLERVRFSVETNRSVFCSSWILRLAKSFSPPPNRASAEAPLVSGRGRRARALYHSVPTTHTQVQHHLHFLQNQATNTTPTHQPHATYKPTHPNPLTASPRITSAAGKVVCFCAMPPRPGLTGESRPLRSRLSTRGGGTQTPTSHTSPKRLECPRTGIAHANRVKQLPRIRFQFSKLAPCLLPLLSILESCTQK